VSLCAFSCTANYLAFYFFTAKHRDKIRYWLFAFDVLFVVFDLTNAISEYFFWNEFELKYNFIAVNYLVYTNEVGNIMESYPVVPLFSGYL
jgi:hypothetical protein